MCITITAANLGAVSGILDLPYGVVYLNSHVPPEDQPAVIRGLLEQAGVRQPRDDVTCTCGRPLGDHPESVAS